jgi:predicted porin
MRDYTAGLISVAKSAVIHNLMVALMTALVLCSLSAELPAETLWTPSVDLSATFDDNVLFEGDDPVDDYIYMIKPGMALDYDQELTKLTADGHVLIRRYQDREDLDDENYRFNLDGSTKFTERFHLLGSYTLIKDTTLDSELQEIGRVFLREDRMSHFGELLPVFNLTERTSIGLEGNYRSVAYDSDANVDYTTWAAGLPVRWRLANQIDTISIKPSASFSDSDTSQTNSYNFSLGWDHESTERLTLSLALGARYTEFERKETDTTDESWGGIGTLQLKYKLETGYIRLDIQQDLQNTAEGDQVDVRKVILRLSRNFSERMGIFLIGRYFHTEDEGEFDDNTTEFISGRAEIFYNMTKNHIIFVAYDYSQEDLKDVDNVPKTERNRIWAGIRLNFPM